MGAIPKTLNRVPGSVRKYVSEAEYEEKYWGAEQRSEWVNGKVIWLMSESDIHVNVLRTILCMMDAYAQFHGLGQVRQSALQIRFADLKRRRCPDIFFVTKRRAGLIKETYLDGSPDLAVEIVSKDSVARDYHEKLMEYQAAGVREYWIVDPLSKNVTVYLLKDDKYVLLKAEEGRFCSKVLKGFYIKPKWLWSKSPPNWLKLLKEMGVK